MVRIKVKPLTAVMFCKTDLCSEAMLKGVENSIYASKTLSEKANVVVNGAMQQEKRKVKNNCRARDMWQQLPVWPFAKEYICIYIYMERENQQANVKVKPAS